MLKIIIFSLILVTIALSGTMSVTDAKTILPPLQQARDGVLAGEVECAGGRVLMV